MDTREKIFFFSTYIYVDTLKFGYYRDIIYKYMNIFIHEKD